MIRCQDEEERWYVRCVDCGAQMPIDWGRGVIEKKGVSVSAVPNTAGTATSGVRGSATTMPL